MKTQRVIAIDPGKATGLAVFSWSLTPDKESPHLLKSYELDQFDTCKFVDDYLDDADTDGYLDAVHIVLERYQQSDKGSDWSIEIIGTIRYLAKLRGLGITLQTPADAKSFVDNEKIKRLGYWHRGGEGHALDAVRHGVLYMVRKQFIAAKSLLSD